MARCGCRDNGCHRRNRCGVHDGQPCGDVAATPLWTVCDAGHARSLLMNFSATKAFGGPTHMVWLPLLDHLANGDGASKSLLRLSAGAVAGWRVADARCPHHLERCGGAGVEPRESARWRSGAPPHRCSPTGATSTVLHTQGDAGKAMCRPRRGSRGRACARWSHLSDPSDVRRCVGTVREYRRDRIEPLRHPRK